MRTEPTNILVAAGLAALTACSAPAPAGAPAPAPGEAGSRAAAETRETPPPPLPSERVEFPPFHETVLPNGLRLIVLEDHDLPVLNVDLYVESGTADDPVEAAGLSEMVADMLTKGTPTRSAEEIASTIEGAGGSLTASASSDYIRAGAAVLADQARLAFELLGDVVLEPTFPADELDILRTRVLSSLQAELAQPGTLAMRRFMREVYGSEHPYSLAATPESVRGIDREDLVRFHDSHFKADNGLLVVSGAISPADAEALARRHFGGWQGGGVPEPSFVAPPARDETRVYFVHRPGSVQSNILVGHVGIRPDDPDYYPLQVLNKVLGGGTDARLFLILREEKGWTYGAYSRMSRPEDVGYFTASAEVRNEVTDSALVEILTQLRRLRNEPISSVELEAAKSYLVGSFPLRIETPAQIAGQLAQNRLLGLPASALTEYRDRISAVSAADVQRVAREYVLPDRAVVVVVGDARQVLDDVARVAPATLYDVEGDPLDPASLEVRAPTVRGDASGLEPVTLVYALQAGGTPIATATTMLGREGEAWVASTDLTGAMTQESEVRFRPDFTPISSRQSMQQGGMSMSSDLEVADGRVTGTVVMPPQMGGERDVDTEVVAGTLLPEMDSWYLAAADLEPGKTITVPQFDVGSASAINVTYDVGEVESITVPAGTFDAYPVRVTGGPQALVLYLRADSPHIMLRQEFTGQPVLLELQEVRD